MSSLFKDKRQTILLIIICFLIGLAIYLTIRSNHAQTITVGSNKEMTLPGGAKYQEYNVSVSASERQIKNLQDSLQKAMSEHSRVSAQSLIEWRDRIVYSGLNSGFSDTVDTMVKTIIENQRLIDSLRGVKNVYIADNIISVPKPFTITKDDNLFIKGEVTKKGVIIDSLTILSQPTIVFGEKKNGLFKPRILTALVGNKNNNIVQENIKAFSYQPKKSKISLVVGPTYAFDGKSMNLGIGATLGFKIF